MDNRTNFNTPILFMSLAAPITFKAVFKLPVFANLDSAIIWKNEKIKNMIKPREMVIVKEINNGNAALYTASEKDPEFCMRALGANRSISSTKVMIPPKTFVTIAINMTINKGIMK